MNAREGSSSAMTSTSSTRVRWNPTKEQLRILENVYNGGNRSPRTEQIQHITAELRRHGNVAGINVFYWFKNRKARERRRMKTSLAPDNSSQIANCESNKGCMGSLSEMNCYMRMDYGGHHHGYLNTNNVSHSNESVMDHHEDQDHNMYSEMSPWWMDCSSSSSREVHAHHETLQLFPPP